MSCNIWRDVRRWRFSLLISNSIWITEVKIDVAITTPVQVDLSIMVCFPFSRADLALTTVRTIVLFHVKRPSTGGFYKSKWEGEDWRGEVDPWVRHRFEELLLLKAEAVQMSSPMSLKWRPREGLTRALHKTLLIDCWETGRETA